MSANLIRRNRAATMQDLGKSLVYVTIVFGGALTGACLGRALGPVGIRLDLPAVIGMTGAAGAALALAGSRTALKQRELRSQNQTLRLAVEQRMSRYSSRVAQRR